ncbi:MAG: cyclophilin [Halobacteriovoraceae bacterium]|nr:cyclophilin [Halobacteriovoraceae bacterium]
MNIQIKFENKVLKIELEENPTSQALYEQLPLKMKFEDYASNEKIFYPPKKLSTKDAPESYKPSRGDVTYYAPWGDVAIFYKDFSSSKGLIKLGRITDGLEHLESLENMEANIEKIK